MLRVVAHLTATNACRYQAYFCYIFLISLVVVADADQVKIPVDYDVITFNLLHLILNFQSHRILPLSIILHIFNNLFLPLHFSVHKFQIKNSSLKNSMHNFDAKCKVQIQVKHLGTQDKLWNLDQVKPPTSTNHITLLLSMKLMQKVCYKGSHLRLGLLVCCPQ